MTLTRPERLGIGDRVRFGGRIHTVIAVSGTMLRLADTDGTVTDVLLAELLAANGFEVLNSIRKTALPASAPLDGLAPHVIERAVWWERHIVEVLRGVAPDALPGAVPLPQYDPAVASLTRREAAKAAELTAAGTPVTASAIAKRRRRYEARGLAGMVDHRVDKQTPPLSRADPLVVAALRQAVTEATHDSSRTAKFLFWRAGQILDAAHGPGVVPLPPQRTLYRMLQTLTAGLHTTGSARTRRSQASRPAGPFSTVQATAPGEWMQIDSTPLDVLVRLDDGVIGRVELTGMIDVATRTVTAAVVRPTTKSVDASVLLARTVTPEPMRPGWAQALAMSQSALPYRRLLALDARLEQAAARPVIVPETIVVDHAKVFISLNFRASCNFLGINFQPCHEATPTDKPHIEKMMFSVGSLFAQYVKGYTGSSVERRGRKVEAQAVWSLPELQNLLDEWLIHWQNRPHDGLRDPAHPARMFTPNEKYAAMVEACGYVPVALSAQDYIELLPATWRAINAYGIKMKHRVYDDDALAPLRLQRSGVKSHKDLWEVHHDPHDISRIWVRDHWNGGWIMLFWNQLHRVAAPFGELAWDHVRRGLPEATEAELADAAGDLMARAHRGPQPGDSPPSKRDLRVAARASATQPTIPAELLPQLTPAGSPDADDAGRPADIVPMPIFDPFAEAEHGW